MSESSRLTVPEAAVDAVEPTWPEVYDQYKCKTCGVWAYQIHGGEWKLVSPTSYRPQVIPEAAVDNRRMTITEFLEARIAEDEADAQTTRALAECAAKRAIVLQHADATSWDCTTDESRCPTLLTLAAIYADHPDYQQEWA